MVNSFEGRHDVSNHGGNLERKHRKKKERFVNMESNPDNDHLPFEHCHDLHLSEKEDSGNSVLTIINLVNPKKECIKILRKRANEINKPITSIVLLYDENVRLDSATTPFDIDLIKAGEVKLKLEFHSLPSSSIKQIISSLGLHGIEVDVEIRDLKDVVSEEDLKAFLKSIEIHANSFHLDKQENEREVDPKTGNEVVKEESVAVDEHENEHSISKTFVSSYSSQSGGGVDTGASKIEHGGAIRSSSDWVCKKCMRSIRRRDKKRHHRRSKKHKSRNKRRSYHD